MPDSALGSDLFPRSSSPAVRLAFSQRKKSHFVSFWWPASHMLVSPCGFAYATLVHLGSAM